MKVLFSKLIYVCRFSDRFGRFSHNVTKRSIFNYLFPFTDLNNPNIAGDTAISKVARLMGHSVSSFPFSSNPVVFKKY